MKLSSCSSKDCPPIILPIAIIQYSITIKLTNVIARSAATKQSGRSRGFKDSPHRPWIDEVVIKCDKCGGELYQRDDDNAETVTSRLEVYESQTLPLIDYYTARGRIRSIDGVGDIKEIFGRVTQVLS